MSGQTLPLLVEIGCEEIPARFVQEARRDFCRLLGEGLVSNGLCHEPPHFPAYHTPRRLVAYVPNLFARQADRVEEVTGPPLKVSFDAQGKPTRAAESFAAKNGVKVEELLQVEMPKGTYLAARRTTLGRSADDILAGLLPQAIRSITFPKSMVWESTGVRFVRPIRWLLALLGEGDDARPIPFELAGVNSGDRTFGHRGSGHQSIGVTGFADYARRLRLNFVEFDSETRLQSVRVEANVLLEDCMSVVPDAALEEWIVNSTEWPTGLRGSFHERFLRLPREILVTVMRNHQKYFAVEDEDGNLLPHFVTVLNRDRDATGVIRAGHERVLTARFSDAEFFWNADQKIPLSDRVRMLERVTYQVKLGSYGDKARRMHAIAARVCDELEGQGRLTPDQRSHVLRAVDLCKCDLTTQMVQEFTELQGVVGGLYGKAQGEPEDVWEAVYDHYKPMNIEDDCPRSVVGAVVSLADKLDAVIAGFSVGLEPTGSSDPFGLRRAGNGIIKLIVEMLPTIDLGILQSGAESLPTADVRLISQVQRFLEERFRFYAETSYDARYDATNAALGPRSSFDRPAAIVNWIKILEKIRRTEDFQIVVQAAKRVRNIIAKSIGSEDSSIDQGIFNETGFNIGAEKLLYEAYKRIRHRGDSLDELSAEDCERFMLELSALRPIVDRYFEDVLVNDPDPDVRRNRLAFLKALRDDVFSRFVNLVEIEIEAAPSAC